MPKPLVRVLPHAGVALCVLAGVFLVSWAGMARNQWELHRLRSERGAQSVRLRQLEEKARAVDKRLEAVNELDQQIRKLVDVGKSSPGATPDPAGGQGGRENPLPFHYAMEDLSRDLDAGSTRLAGAQRLLRHRLDYLAAIPSSSPGWGPITSSFGARRSPFGSRLEFHDGLDLDLPHGAAARAAAAGVVASAGYEPGYGNTVTIRHGHGFASRYAHLSAFDVSAGDPVERGDIVGRVGSTGRSTGPHLHFMVLKDGQPQDPVDYLVP